MVDFFCAHKLLSYHLMHVSWDAHRNVWRWCLDGISRLFLAIHSRLFQYSISIKIFTFISIYWCILRSSLPKKDIFTVNPYFKVLWEGVKLNFVIFFSSKGHPQHWFLGQIQIRAKHPDPHLCYSLISAQQSTEWNVEIKPLYKKLPSCLFSAIEQ